MIKANKGSIPVSTLIVSILLTAVLCAGGVYFLMQGDKDSVLNERSPLNSSDAKVSGDQLENTTPYQADSKQEDSNILISELKITPFRLKSKPPEGKIHQDYTFDNSRDMTFTSIEKHHSVSMNREAIAYFYANRETLEHFYAPQNPDDENVVFLSSMGLDGKYSDGPKENYRSPRHIYTYNLKTGELHLIYEDEGEMSLRVMGVDGSKLIILADYPDNSPGQCYNEWFNSPFSNSFIYLDLNDIDSGFHVYKIPEYKLMESQKKSDKCINEMQEEYNIPEPSEGIQGPPAEPISYSLGEVPAVLMKQISTFDDSAEDFSSLAAECGYNESESHFKDLSMKFYGAEKTLYKIYYQNKKQNESPFTITLLPNKFGYNSLDEFKKDFDQCFAGGDAYPTTMNDDWLVFISSCGTGFADNSGRPNGCAEVSEVVSPTLKLN